MNPPEKDTQSLEEAIAGDLGAVVSALLADPPNDEHQRASDGATAQVWTRDGWHVLRLLLAGGGTVVTVSQLYEVVAGDNGETRPWRQLALYVDLPGVELHAAGVKTPAADWWPAPGAAGHTYLSTSCLHDVHDHCRGTVSVTGGPKEPATCKYCPARCVCGCHRPATTTVEP